MSEKEKVMRQAPVFAEEAAQGQASTFALAVMSWMPT